MPVKWPIGRFEMMSALKNPLAVTVPTLVMLILTPLVTFAQQINDTNEIIIMVNIERIRAQLRLADRSMAEGDSEMAFAHAFIPHTTTFPSIKSQLKEIDDQSATRLEALLTDLPVNIRSADKPVDALRQDIVQIESLIDRILIMLGPLASDKAMTSQTVVFLLRDAVQSYQLSDGGSSQVDYENSIGLVNAAELKYEMIAHSLAASRSAEINSFFTGLKSSLEQKAENDSLERFTDGIERDLAEDLSLSSGSESAGENAKYLSNIRTLLASVVTEVESGDYEQADQYAITAYLDNFEYLEAPIEKHDTELKETLEIEMREELRGMIRDERPAVAIEEYVNGILEKLDKAEELLANDASFNQRGGPAGFADIEGLAAGFGTYSGERKDIGQVDDPAKAAVRASIDQIRVKLDGTLRLYKEGNAEGALLTSRSAYLDSYEKIEIPLRPIDPDFTLDMEIKFAELRNMIQSGATYAQVEAKVIEIRHGLDESERLVSGIGIVAPAIAFSTSFSIIFREGLESALIVGAILTYLEASRNERFNKHVYYGILIAFAATAATWFIAQFIIDISGASKALIEAIAGVSAVAVLFWVSFWILNKVETKKWIEFVKAKVWKATTTGSVMVFVMLSFFTVYREGFETVLFYQAIISFAKYMEWYVIAGLVAGLVVIAGVTFVVRKLGRKLPLRVLFGLTMGIGAYMSIAFIGNAVREFQEVGYIQTTHLIGTVPRLDINTAAMTGIHPTLETIVAQLVLLCVYLVGSLHVLVIQPRRNRAIESARKSRADFAKKKEAKDVQ
ncbi:MAG TPA: FTR1 family protein [Nitrososphaera sp.]|nr:FTR1 family protein [Nitrososphaera sp.]